MDIINSDKPLLSQFEPPCTTNNSEIQEQMSISQHQHKFERMMSSNSQSKSVKCQPQSPNEPLNYFPRDQLCSHTYADHNYYVICRWILSPTYATNSNISIGTSNYCPKGLLYDLPQRHPKLSKLLDLCAEGKSGIERGIMVNTILQKMRDVYKQKYNGMDLPESDYGGDNIIQKEQRNLYKMS